MDQPTNESKLEPQFRSSFARSKVQGIGPRSNLVYPLQVSLVDDSPPMPPNILTSINDLLDSPVGEKIKIGLKEYKELTRSPKGIMPRSALYRQACSRISPLHEKGSPIPQSKGCSGSQDIYQRKTVSFSKNVIVFAYQNNRDIHRV